MVNNQHNFKGMKQNSQMSLMLFYLWPKYSDIATPTFKRSWEMQFLVEGSHMQLKFIARISQCGMTESKKGNWMQGDNISYLVFTKTC